MRNNIALLHLVPAFTLCILTELKGRAGDLFLPPNDSICQGNAFITTQGEWDQFAADYAGCTTFVGDITIDNSAAAIDSLYGLDSIRVMVGNLVVEYAGVPFVFNTLNSLDSLGGDLSISNCPENFSGLYHLRFAEDIVLTNANLSTTYENDNTHTSIESLVSCSTISMRAGNSIDLFQEYAFNNLIQCRKIEFLGDNGNQSGVLFDSFNNLTTADTVIVRYTGSTIGNCFQNLTTADVVEIAGDNNYIMAVDGLSSLTTAQSLTIRTNGFAPNFSNLISIGNIWIEESPMNVGVNLPMLSSLEVITNGAVLILSRDTIMLNSLVHAGGLNILATNDYYENRGVKAILLPQLTNIFGDLVISTTSYSPEGDTSLRVFSAPLLTAIGGEIIISAAPFLSNCISPAFCESANYSPNWGEISGGPGCSSIEEIQAQCVAVDNPEDTICTGHFYFTRQSEIDSFLIAHPYCNTINGSITLNNITNEIFNVEGFSNIRYITEDLRLLFQAQYFDLSGFIELDSIGDSLIMKELDWIYSDTPQQMFFGLSGVQSMGHFVFDNGYLFDEPDLFPSLTQCQTITFYKWGRYNLSITNSFNSLTTVDSIRYVNANPGIWGDYFYLSFWGSDYAAGSASLGWYFAVSNSFNSLHTAQAVFFDNGFGQINESFVQLESVNSITIGATEIEYSPISINQNSFSNLNSANSVRVIVGDDSNHGAVNFPQFQSLRQANTVYHSSVVLGTGNNNFGELTFHSLEHCDSFLLICSGDSSAYNFNFPELTTTGTFFFFIENATLNITFPNLLSADNLNIGSIYYIDVDGGVNSFRADSLEIVGSMHLTNMDTISLMHLDSITNQLSIYGSAIANLSALDNVSYVHSIILSDNPNLSDCSIQAMCERLQTSPSAISISGNAPGCNSIEEVQTQCLGSYASGTVYYDLNCDAQFNNNDALVSYPILLQGDTLPIGSSGEAGYFFVPLEFNTTTSLYVQHSADWSIAGPLTLTTADTLEVFSGLEIGLCPVTIIHDLAVHMNASMDPRPGFTVRYNLVAQNLWPGSDAVTVTFSSAQMPGAVITGYAAGGALNANQVSFTTNLLYGQSQTFWVDVLVPVGTPLGTAYTATASITLSDAQAVDSHPENNTYTLHQTVIGSYDPNDKLVTPAVIDLLDIDSTQTATIEYTIRFQNTGTAEAIFVRVLDTLSQALNPATFELIATSHPSEITFHDNHTIEWFFDNILLPDSFTNEPASHGFIQFRIQTLPLSEPFNLENEAAIYFDFNEPVITPPAVTSVVICAEAGEACDDGDACTVNDLTQPDCSCLGTFVDTDSDGVCDAEDMCDNTLAGSACDDLDPCTTNDLIQPDCSCLGTFADADSDGVCDTLDTCAGAPLVLSADSDITLPCGSDVPAFNATFEMTDGSEVTVSYIDSVLNCNFDLLQTAIAVNACGDSAVVSRTITIEDLTPPQWIECLPETTLVCATSGAQLTPPVAIDNCSQEVIVTYSENCIDCNADSIVYPCFTPVLPSDNPCNYPSDWSLALFSLPMAHRWFQVDTSVPALMTDYLNGSVHYTGRWINAQDSTGGFDYMFTIGNGLDWQAWSTDDTPSSYVADCGGIDENHEEWMYYILQNAASAELLGWGSYAGSQLDINHAPSNLYFGYQIGLGANGYNSQYGMGGWATYSGIALYNGQPIAGGMQDGVCDIRFAMPACADHTSEVTWTAIDCSGNSTSCTQLVHYTTTQEIEGCTDPAACNFNANATTDDGSCSYVDSFAIVGNTNVTAGIPEEYTYPGQPSSSFEWIATPGTITAGQGTPAVSVVWDDAPAGTIQVTETHESNCVGEPVTLQVNIAPNSIASYDSPRVSLYPNPTFDRLFISGNIPSSANMTLFNSVGQCVETGSFRPFMEVRDFAEGIYFLRLEIDGTTIQKAFTILRQP